MIEIKAHMHRINCLTIALVLILMGLSACSTSNEVYLQETEKTSKNLRAAADYNVQLGLNYLQQQRSAFAKRKLLLALKQAPDWPVAWDAMAYYLDQTGNKKAADEYFKKALKLAPHSAMAMNNYGAFLCRDKQYAKAEHYLLLAANDPQYVNSAEAFENAAICELRLPNLHKAERYFYQALQQDPTRATSLYELAKINYQRKDYKQAQLLLKKYAKVAKPNPQSLYLAILTSKELHDSKAMAKDVKILTSEYPHSNEFKLYKKAQVTT